jgi:hypothetical protein
MYKLNNSPTGGLAAMEAKTFPPADLAEYDEINRQIATFTRSLCEAFPGVMAVIVQVIKPETPATATVLRVVPGANLTPYQAIQIFSGALKAEQRVTPDIPVYDGRTHH